MTFKPDFGLRRMNDGISRDADLNFYDFRLYSLTVLGLGEYSTMVEVPFDRKVYALSLDFNQKHLDHIVDKATPEMTAFIRDELDRDPSTPRTIDFEDAIVFGVRARLGELQRGQYESFVPLVAQEIL